MSDNDHPEFDNDDIWPRRLLHVSTMTSHKWQPGSRYNGQREPRYNAISYTWGRWRLDDGIAEKPDETPIEIRKAVDTAFGSPKSSHEPTHPKYWAMKKGAEFESNVAVLPDPDYLAFEMQLSREVTL
ncbi:hypothetical protein BDW74DRAFT_175089 [Aspergillus multicolor]|uniref:uncharacterized protein n=1 Tax=Aspergillus multicolor TaxID=41759 RepID=UPI003CCD8B2C